MDLVLDFLDVAKLGGKAEDGASGAEADVRVRVVQDFAKLKNGLEGEALEVALGELGGLALLLGVLLPGIRGLQANGAGCGGRS